MGKDASGFELKLNDGVKHAPSFLKLIEVDRDNPMWSKTGTIVRTGEVFVKVLWDGDVQPSLMNSTNLAKIPRGNSSTSLHTNRRA